MITADRDKESQKAQRSGHLTQILFSVIVDRFQDVWQSLIPLVMGRSVMRRRALQTVSRSFSLAFGQDTCHTSSKTDARFQARSEMDGRCDAPPGHTTQVPSRPSGSQSPHDAKCPIQSLTMLRIDSMPQMIPLLVENQVTSLAGDLKMMRLKKVAAVHLASTLTGRVFSDQSHAVNNVLNSNVASHFRGACPHVTMRQPRAWMESVILPKERRQRIFRVSFQRTLNSIF
jgi:hypothetical protein